MVEPLLSVRGLVAGYGDVDVLRGIDLEVAPAKIVAVLGSNGVGKTTLNKTLSGVLRPRRARSAFDGERIDRLTPPRDRRGGPHPCARGPAHFPRHERARKPRARRLSARQAERAASLEKSSRPFRACASASASSRARSQAASSRCSRSAAG